MLGHGVGNGTARFDVVPDRLDDLLEPGVLSLLLEDVESAEHSKS